MKLIPYTIQKKDTGILSIYRLSLFLSEGGRALWEIGSETNVKKIQEEYLEDNGFFCTSVDQWNDIYFAPIDSTKTDIKSFYTWEELQESQGKRRDECFRTFVFCYEQPQEKTWFHSEVCHQPFDGSKETPSAIFEGLKNTYYKKV